MPRLVEKKTNLARKYMPRLVEKKTNLALYVSLIVLIAAIGTVALEYFGVIDFIPDFGKDSKTNGTSSD